MLQAGLPPASDRMLTTCFLAALFHGVVILGVTFSAPQGKAGGPDAPALEVVLVNGQAPRAVKNPNARYVAQRSQLGTGMPSTDRTSIPQSSSASADRMGAAGGSGVAAQRAMRDLGDDESIATHAPTPRILYFAAATAAKEPAQVQELLEKRPNLQMMPNDDGVELRMRGETRDQLWIAADTRESDVAVYLDSWRRKIERVGTTNFPDAARRRNLSGTPVIEVTIGADGRLLDTQVRRSSGHSEIDQAAMRILKLASPYDAFPVELNAKHDQIRIAYEWQFLGGSPQGSRVLYADPNAPGGKR